MIKYADSAVKVRNSVTSAGECGHLMNKHSISLEQHFLDPVDVRKLPAKEILQVLKVANLSK
jgi:hypothetical protein